MTLEFVVDSLDKVEESLRGIYVEQDGKHHLDVDKYAEFKAQGLKAKNKELLDKYTKAKAFEEKAKKFEGIEDDDLEEFNEWKSKRDDPNNKDDKNKADTIAKEEHERALKKERDKAAKEKEELVKNNQSLMEENRQFKIWNPVSEAAGKTGVMADRLTAFLKVLRSDSRFDLDEKGKVIFKDADGDETDLTIEKAFEALKKEFAWAFKASGVGGSGADNNNNGSGNGADLSKLSATERLKAARR
jgi:hypothetical protein